VARFIPPSSDVPASINKYLLPRESHVITARQHPAVLLSRLSLVLLGLAVAGLLTGTVAHGKGILVVWILWAMLVLWLGIKIWDWAIHYFVVTSQRLMLAQGVILRKVNFIPLDKVTDVEYRRSSTGRLLGYGELEVYTAGQESALRHIRFVPYPNQVYQEVTGLLFKDTGQCPECAMNIPGAARRCPYCQTKLR
jgi:uncharacterized membrane protein YdbT with pleckstrin-like domain